MKKYIAVSMSFFLIISVSLINYQKEIELKFNNENITFAYYIDNVVSNTAPENNSNYIFDDVNSSCSNGANVRWNYEEWSAVVTNIPTTKTKCHLKFKAEYNESILNGTYPVLKDPLIPVTIEDDGTVKRGDLSTEWYSYTNKKWANAIILKDESTKNNYKTNDVIPEDAIESYFVWIPRYRYKIFNEGNYPTLTTLENKVQEIEVVFENRETALSNGSRVGNWLTHPAFISFNVNGFWVGKFETGTTLSNNFNVRNGEAIQIKPNLTPWRYIEVASAFYTTYDYKRNLESHMMKNTEWGSVAYLQHSKYGSQASVRINNNGNYLTGSAAVNEPTCGYTASNEECNKYGITSDITLPYNTTTGYLASTTGNISGIYDMSGGTWEYVMGVMLDEKGVPISGENNLFNSGFLGPLSCPSCDGGDSSIAEITTGYAFPDKRYYDAYTYGTSDQHYERRILGDATGEAGPFEFVLYTGINGEVGRNINSWYADLSSFLASNIPWFIRGGDAPIGLGAGILSFGSTYGAGYGHMSFRTVLSPEGT